MAADHDSNSLEHRSATRVTELCVNLDDTPGEVVGDACETLLADGALDVWTTAIHMKKQRPGVTLHVLAPTPDADRFARRLLQLTGSFGVRFRDWDRLVLDRRFVTVPTELGDVTLKVGSLDGRTLVVQPEFASVKSLAAAHGLTVREAFTVAHAAARAWQAQQADAGDAA